VTAPAGAFLSGSTTPIATAASPPAPSSYTVERPRARAVLISARGHGAFIIDSIETFATSKDDSSDAGTFTMTAPLIDNAQAAAAGGPMDLVAIFADRSWADENGNTYDGTQIGPQSAAGLSYGQIGTIQALAADPTCIFIGMIDKPHHRFDLGTPAVSFQIEGRDLTKVFLSNDTDIPFIATGALAYGNIAQLQIARDGYSGPQLLEIALDRMVTKSGLGGYAAGGTVPLSAFGYPWREFVRTDLLDTSFLSFAGNKYPPFNLQDGTSWATVMELKNDPLCRLFVNEQGALIFDDSYQAWTTRTPIIVTAEDVRSVDFYQDDSNVIGFLTIQPFTAELNNPISQSFGVGVTPFKNLDIVKTYGYRMAAWQSYYDLDQESANLRAPTMWAWHNDLFHCQITLKGRREYQAGIRIQLKDIGGLWPETVGATWYVLDCQHAFDWGNDWTTTMHLRFPRTM
jgi:hypothetical protein